MTEVVERIEALRSCCEGARRAGGDVGLVPTMGYLHDGHRSLVRAARRANDLVVVTIFVNPLQFGPSEDLDRYPRDLDRDLAVLRSEGVDVAFAPAVTEMLPEKMATTVHVAGLTQDLCGASRPGHFDGVTTIVAKLFAITGPCRAYFGRKDAQQLAVVSRMVADLDLPVEVVGCTLVREPDGLALSSRNAYLSPGERRAATVLFRSLRAAAEAVCGGERDPRGVVTAARAVLDTEPAVEPEYVELRSAGDLSHVEHVDGDLLLALAARVGATRLIDNVRMQVHGTDVLVDLGTGFAPGGRSSTCNEP